jgi:hypothetical protein
VQPRAATLALASPPRIGRASDRTPSADVVRFGHLVLGHLPELPDLVGMAELEHRLLGGRQASPSLTPGTLRVGAWEKERVEHGDVGRGDLEWLRGLVARASTRAPHPSQGLTPG